MTRRCQDTADDILYLLEYTDVSFLEPALFRQNKCGCGAFDSESGSQCGPFSDTFFQFEIVLYSFFSDLLIT